MLAENIEDRPQGSDIQGLSADLIEAARRRNLSASLGSRLEFRSAASSFSYRLRGLLVPGRGEERREPQTDPRRAFLCLQALGPEKPVRQDRTSRPASHNRIVGFTWRIVRFPGKL